MDGENEKQVKDPLAISDDARVWIDNESTASTVDSTNLRYSYTKVNDCNCEITVKTESDLASQFTRNQRPSHRKNLPRSEKNEDEIEKSNIVTTLLKLLPIIHWLPRYSKDTKYWQGSNDFTGSIRRDVIAGVVIGIMLVPQGMAYGMLAGLPPIYGLYTSMWSLVAYMVTGTCRFLGPGVNAPISLLVADALDGALGLETSCGDDTSSQDCQEFIDASLLVCMMVGVIYILFAVFNLGIVTSLMPGPSLAGFTTGASMIIIASNMKFFLGMTLDAVQDDTNGFFKISKFSWTIYQIFLKLPNHQDRDGMNVTSLIIGVFSLLILRGIQELNKHPKIKKKLPIPIPEQLVVLIISTMITAFARLNDAPYNVPIVGKVPSGLYSPKFPPLTNFSKLISPAILISIVTYILTINVAKAVAAANKLNVDANQELISLAAQSLVGGLTGACVPSGSFSRTALIVTMDAETPMHNLVTCIVMGFVLLVLTESVYFLPKAVLAAVIFLAVKNMITFSRAKELWSVSKAEWLQWMVAFLFTTIFGVDIGIYASIGLSVIMILKNASFPYTAVLGVLPDTQHYVPLKLYPSAKEVDGVKIFQFDAPLTFSSMGTFENKLLKMLIQNVAEKPIHTIVIDCRAVMTVDTSAGRMMQSVIEAQTRCGRRIFFANWRGLDDVGRKVLESLKFDEKIPQNHFFLTITDAITTATNQSPEVLKGELKEEQ